MITNCNIDSIVKKELQTTIVKLSRKNKNNETGFKNALKKLYVDDYNKFNKDTFIDAVVEVYEKSKIALKLNNLADISKEDLIAIYTDPNTSVSEIIDNKTDSLEQSDIFSDYSDSFISSVYGTSTAKDKLLRFFNNYLTDCTLIDFQRLKEIHNSEAINTNLIDLQEKLYGQILDSFKGYLKDSNLPNKLFNEDGTVNLKVLNTALYGITKDLFTINELQKYGDNPLLSKRFNALNALFILNHFDAMIKLRFNKMVKINHHRGVLTNAKDKYEFHFENTNKVNQWRDDSKDVNAIDETSDVNRMLVERIPLLGMDGKPIPNAYLNLQQVISMNTLIKSLASHPNAKIPINSAIAFDGKALSNLDEEINNIINIPNTLTNKSLQDLINEAIDDQVVGVRNLFTVLAGNRLDYNSLGIYSNMQQIIKSYYQQVFAPEGSYWEIYLRSLKENYGINDQPEFYFTYLTQMFGSHEAIDSQEYQRDGSNINNITLKESTDATQTYYIDAQIGGKFGINAKTKFKTFEVINVEKSLKYEDDGKTMDPYIDIEILSDKNEKVTVRKYGRHARLMLVENGNEMPITEDLFKNCTKFLQEVLNFDFNESFIANLENRNSNYHDLIFSLVGNILYNYELTQKLNDDPTLVKKQDYIDELAKYYNPEEKISVRTDIKQIQFTNRSDAVAKILLSNSYDDVHNINRTNVTKDADNKQIGSNGLDQVATKPTSQWARSNKQNEALKAFSLNRVYRGQEFARDFKGPSGNKKATEFSEAENFIGTFMYDYLSRLYGKDETAAIVKLLPSVISDKSRIPKTLFDLNAESTIENDEGEYKKYKDLNTDEWKSLTKTELGNYYQSIYEDASSKFETIQSIINNLIKQDKDNQSGQGTSLLAKYTDSVELDYDSNFQKFNTLIQQIADSEHLNTGDLIQQILHEAILESQNNSTYSSVELTNIIHYAIDRNGNLQGNALLFDQLYRFGKIDINHSAYKAYGLNSGYGTFEEFWESKKLQYVGDLLKDDAEILRFDAYGNEFTGAGFKALKDWKRGENIVFANIEYTVITDNGQENKILPITSKWDLKNSFIYKQIRRYKGLPQYAEVKDFVNIDSPLFDFGKFMQAIQIYNNDQYSQESIERKIKSTIKDLVNNEIKDKDGNKIKVEDNDINIKDYVSKLLADEASIKELPPLTKQVINIPTLLQLNSKFQANTSNLVKQVNNIKKYNALKKSNNLNIEYKFEINPFLERYQITDYMLSSEYINATVGTHINHPSSFSKPPIIWGHPALGKTYALNTHDFIDWDVEFNEKRNKWIANQTNTVIGTSEFKNAQNEYLVNWENHEDFKQFVTQEWNRVKRLAVTQNKMLIASPHMLLKLFPKDFDQVINIPKEDFIERGKNRGDKHPEQWKEGIDNTIKSVLPYIKGKIIEVKPGEYLTDLIAKGKVNLKFNNLRQKESEAWGQQVKRNVSLTASKYKFALNLIDGIKSEYTVAVIEDDKDIVYNIYGKKDKVKPFDGATICGLGTNYLENRSLKGDHAGIDKKQFIHDYKANSGTGIIVKTAGFALTNWRIRNSKALQNINRKMLDISFGNDVVDITRDYDGKPLLTTKEQEDHFLIPESQYGDMAYVEFDGKHDIIYRTVGVVYDKVEKNKAHILRQVLTKEGWVTDTDFAKELISLDSNYAIYKYVFGGENSIDIKTNDINNLKLSADLNWVFSENSAKQLAFAMNRVGTKKPGVKQAVSQNDVYQPMKQHTIDYVITEGAIKQGAANMNNKRAYYDPNYKWTTMKLGMYDAGIQLDAEHHADASTLSLMTQVLNVLGARGYSALDAEETYQAMYSLTNEIVKDFDLGSMGIKSGNHEDMQKFISKIILDSIKTVGSSDGNLITALSQTIMQEYQRGNKVTYDLIRDNMPISNPATFNKMISSIAAALTKKCIRIPFPGSMDVLAPSNRLYLLYNDHLLSYYRGKVEDLGYKLINNTGEIDLGRTYKITYADGIEEELLIDDPDVYYRIKSKNIVRIEENLSAGRDLASYNITFKVGDVTYNMWDLDSIQDLYTTDKLFEQAIQQGNSELMENLKAKVEYQGDNSEFHNFLMQKLQNTLNNLHNGGQVKINGGQLVTISDLKIRPYEVIMTKIYETTFGLKPGDDIQEIVNNKLFFCKRALENFNASVNTRHYDLELKVLNGQHVYLTRQPSSDLTKVENVEKRWEGDTLVWYKDGKKIRNLASEKDEIYMDSNGNEIIVTENFNFYINDTSFLHLNISPSAGVETTFALLQHLQENNENTAVKSLLENLGFTKDSTKEDAFRIVNVIEKGHEEYKAGLDAIKEYIKNPEQNFDAFFASIKSKAIRSIINNSLEIHTSFIKSLNTLAARIPAQSHQSFMAMRVVGFDESGKNTAYVNRMQLYLQGSDY